MFERTRTSRAASTACFRMSGSHNAVRLARDSCVVWQDRLRVGVSMTSFSERFGYKPRRTRLHQYEAMDSRLRNAIWNFLLEAFLSSTPTVQAQIEIIWTDVIGGRLDDFPAQDDIELHLVDEGSVSFLARDALRAWYLEATWNEVYDLLEFLLRGSQDERDVGNANSVLSGEGSAYRFVAGAIAPLTNDGELAEIEAAAELPNPFLGASEHIRRALVLLSNKEHPDPSNAIKESISAVESAAEVATEGKVGMRKALQRMEVHPQLAQAWSNMYNWTSDEDGIRHGMKELPTVGIAEARYMVVACSAFVNYLVAKHSEE